MSGDLLTWKSQVTSIGEAAEREAASRSRNALSKRGASSVSDFNCDEVLATIKKANSDLDVHEIMERTGFGYTAVRKYISILEKEGLIARRVVRGTPLNAPGRVPSRWGIPRKTD